MGLCEVRVKPSASSGIIYMTVKVSKTDDKYNIVIGKKDVAIHFTGSLYDFRHVKQFVQ